MSIEWRYALDVLIEIEKTTTALYKWDGIIGKVRP